ncbi:Cell death protease [Ascosphaera pollenicola]|nr:Cell death protease [Ascosphaera pollenicola]
MEIGPFRLTTDHTLRHLNSSWNEFANMLFVDQPLGTGFSYANTDSLDHEMVQVADHMVTFLENWFAIFPQYQSDDLYVAGESYAGQHIPYIAKAIIDRNQRTRPDSTQWNLQGLLIGNGWISPREQYEAYTKFAKQRGLLVPGTDAAKFVDERMALCLALYEQPEAYDRIDIGDCEAVLSTIMSETEKDGMCYNMYDIRLKDSYPSCGSNWPPDLEYLTPYLRREDVKKALHINADKKTGWEECSGSVSKQLQNRNSKPAVQLLPSIIDAGVPLLLFSGADDMICNHIGTEDMLANLQWADAKGFGDAPRYDWVFGGETIGFYQAARNLTYVLFYNASHMVPFDHPARAVDMLNRFMGVDTTGVISVPTGFVLDGANSTAPIDLDLDAARNKALQEQELQEMRVQNDQRLRSAVHDAYMRVFTACAFISCVALAGVVTFVFCRRRKQVYESGSQKDLGSYARVAEDEDAVPLTRVVPGEATFSDVPARSSSP